MENIVQIQIGRGDYYPCTRPENIAKVTMKLCLDARKAECPYYSLITINTDHLAFEQGLCVWDFRKEDDVIP